MEGWTKIKPGAAYAGMKERAFRDWLKNGLQHVRLPSGTILIKYRWIDNYLEKFVANENQVDDIVSECLKQIK